MWPVVIILDPVYCTKSCFDFFLNSAIFFVARHGITWVRKLGAIEKKTNCDKRAPSWQLLFSQNQHAEARHVNLHDCQMKSSTFLPIGGLSWLFCQLALNAIHNRFCLMISIRPLNCGLFSPSALCRLMQTAENVPDEEISAPAPRPCRQVSLWAENEMICDRHTYLLSSALPERPRDVIFVTPRSGSVT